ncbi:MAG: hypothetical protein R2827_00935 [Bdellovibrionales bacterium]
MGITNIYKYMLSATIVAASIMVGASQDSTATDHLPYEGPKVGGECIYNKAYYNNDVTSPVEVTWDKDCKTAFVKAPAISFQMLDTMLLSPGVAKCGAFNNKHQLIRRAGEKINDLEIRDVEYGLTSEEQQQYSRLLGLRARHESEFNRMEKEYSKAWGGNANIWVDFSAWNEGLELLRQANPPPMRNFDVKRVPTSYGFLSFITTDISLSETGSNSYGRGDASILRDFATGATPIPEEFENEVRERFALDSNPEGSIRLFGSSTNVLLEFSLYGACLIDRNGDQLINDEDRIDLESMASAERKIENAITFNYSYFYPVRTGTIVEARIINPDAIISAIESYREKNPNVVNIATFREHIKDVITDNVDTTVLNYYTRERVADYEDEQKVIDLIEEELGELLIHRLVNLSSESAEANHFRQQHSHRHRYCKRKIFGHCISHGHRTSFSWSDHTNYEQMISDIKVQLDNASSAEKVIFKKETLEDTVGGQFFERNL